MNLTDLKRLLLEKYRANLTFHTYKLFQPVLSFIFFTILIFLLGFIGQVIYIYTIKGEGDAQLKGRDGSTVIL